MLNKSNVIKKVSLNVGLNKIKTKDVIENFLDLIINEVSEGGTVNLSGFGKFILTESSARKARNPKTGDPVDVPAKSRMKFKASKLLEREIVNS